MAGQAFVKADWNAEVTAGAESWEPARLALAS